MGAAQDRRDQYSSELELHYSAVMDRLEHWWPSSQVKTILSSANQFELWELIHQPVQPAVTVTDTTHLLSLTALVYESMAVIWYWSSRDSGCLNQADMSPENPEASRNCPQGEIKVKASGPESTVRCVTGSEVWLSKQLQSKYAAVDKMFKKKQMVDTVERRYCVELPKSAVYIVYR